jgi:hypothetical protein
VHAFNVTTEQPCGGSGMRRQVTHHFTQEAPLCTEDLRLTVEVAGWFSTVAISG